MARFDLPNQQTYFESSYHAEGSGGSSKADEFEGNASGAIGHRFGSGSNALNTKLSGEVDCQEADIGACNKVVGATVDKTISLSEAFSAEVRSGATNHSDGGLGNSAGVTLRAGRYFVSTDWVNNPQGVADGAKRTNGRTGVKLGKHDISVGLSEAELPDDWQQSTSDVSLGYSPNEAVRWSANVQDVREEKRNGLLQNKVEALVKVSWIF